LDSGFPGLTQVFIDLALLVSLRYMQREEVLLKVLHGSTSSVEISTA